MPHFSSRSRPLKRAAEVKAGRALRAAEAAAAAAASGTDSRTVGGGGAAEDMALAAATQVILGLAGLFRLEHPPDRPNPHSHGAAPAPEWNGAACVGPRSWNVLRRSARLRCMGRPIPALTRCWPVRLRRRPSRQRPLLCLLGRRRRRPLALLLGLLRRLLHTCLLVCAACLWGGGARNSGNYTRPTNNYSNEGGASGGVTQAGYAGVGGLTNLDAGAGSRTNFDAGDGRRINLDAGSGGRTNVGTGDGSRTNLDADDGGCPNLDVGGSHRTNLDTSNGGRTNIGACGRGRNNLGAGDGGGGMAKGGEANLGGSTTEGDAGSNNTSTNNNACGGGGARGGACCSSKATHARRRRFDSVSNNKDMEGELDQLENRQDVRQLRRCLTLSALATSSLEEQIDSHT